MRRQRALLNRHRSFQRSSAAGITRLRQEHRRIFLIIQLWGNLPISDLLDLKRLEPFVGYAVEMNEGALCKVLDISGWREHPSLFHLGGGRFNGILRTRNARHVAQVRDGDRVHFWIRSE